MINVAMVGLGRWGQTVLNSIQGKSSRLRIVHGVTKEPELARELAAKHGFRLSTDLKDALADPQYVFPSRQRLHGLAESLRHLSQHHWRWNRLAQLVAHEHRQLGSGCQPADIAVEVETVEALHFQRDVPIKEFRDGCQFPDFTTKLGSVLVGLRSKTSLAYAERRRSSGRVCIAKGIFGL